MKLLFASNNPGKIRELNLLCQDLSLSIIPQSEMNVSDIEETGLTFIENAILKARHASAVTKLPALADDSGLVVPALDGAPGIYSARYAGPSNSSEKNIQKLLADMQNFSGAKRNAYFYCVLACMLHENDPTPLICQGIWHGKILEKPQGDTGFGYDPIFFVPSENKSAAELPLEIKNTLSHRGQALRQLITKLKEPAINRAE